MPDTSSLDKVFTKAFANQHEGHAIYPPVSTKNIKPGMCGYFDTSGNWHKIAQLTNVEEAKQLLGDKVKPLDRRVQPEVENDLETNWSAKESKTVKGKAIEIGAGAAPPGSPAGASAGWEYVCESSSGAVILVPDTESIITTGLDKAYIMRDWMNDHVKEIVKGSDHKTISKKGLWLITRTYAAPRRAVTVMTAKGHTASFHLAAKVQDAAKAEASAAWWSSDQSSSGWIQSKATEEGEGVILFIQGIWWRSGGFFEKSWVQEEAKKHQVLGEGDERDPVYVDLPRQESSSTDDADMNLLELYAEAVGTDKKNLKGLPECKDSYSVYENDGE